MSNTLTKIDIPHIECPALNVLAVLAAESAVSFGLALTGGAVRNAALGLGPTDHDIIIFDYEQDMGLIQQIDEVLKGAGYDLDCVNDNAEYADARVEMVRQYTHDVYPELDVLFHPDEISVQSVLTTHDFNINNYVVVVDDICDSERQTAYFVGDNPPGILVRQPYQAAIHPNRQAHVVDIADRAGWCVPPKLRPNYEQPKPFQNLLPNWC